jgi:hypothetical protein
VAFIKATHSISGRDIVEEYMACGLYPLSASFGLGEIEDGEMPVSKINLPMPKFPIARLLGETNNRFRARVELAVENVVGSYAHWEHDVCITAVPNKGRLNRVFEQAGMPYGPQLEPGSEASKEAAIKWRTDASTKQVGKRVKVFGRKAVALKAPTGPKSMGVASSKAAPSHSKSMLKTGVVPKASVLSKAGAPVKAAMPKSAMMLAMPKDGVFRIGTVLKIPSIELS